MEIRNITSFIKITELGSFSKAAGVLGYSQSNVTMQIKQLEQELGTKLFDRIGKSVQLTEDGRKFLKYAAKISSAAENAKRALIPDSEPSGELRIGLLESLCITYLPQIIKEYHLLYPNVNTVIRIGTYEELSNMLNTNAIDLFWTFDTRIQKNEWSNVFEYSNKISIISSASHPFASMDTVSLSELITQPFILTENNCSYRILFENLIRNQNLELNIFLEIGNTEIIKKFVSAGIALSVLPDFTLKEERMEGKLQVVNVKDFSLVMYGQIFYHKSKWITPAITEFVNLAKKNILSL
jgi:DNA-binding transcriptional LysR family regulator